jgi:polysaccharide deacetylase 2 family uncharacterized protein YibQ
VLALKLCAQRAPLKVLAWASLLGLASSFAAQANETPVSTSTAQVQIAIIIDDLGYHKSAGERAISLPGAVTLAVLPYQTHTQVLAQAAVDAGKELILHAPMEPHNQVPWEEGGLSSGLSLQDMQQALTAMLASVPQATGINNHMGSKFTEDPAAMQWLMTELKDHELFFVDSLTSPGSLAWSSAQTLGVPSLKRDIFLDNVAKAEQIEVQFQKLVKVARKRGYAVAIGHPYTATLEVLETYLPQLSHLGVELVPASRLIEIAAKQRRALSTKEISASKNLSLQSTTSQN